jgi:hypothetical protein
MVARRALLEETTAVSEFAPSPIVIVWPLLYVNTTSGEKGIPTSGKRQGIISRKVYRATLILGPEEADLIH